MASDVSPVALNRLSGVVIGVGIDVVAIDRFAATLERSPRLRDRLFTPAERELPVASLAARFAVKEAVAKALGAPVGLRWLDAEVRRVSGGRPQLVVTGTVADLAERLGVRSWHVSMSHDAGIASAVVIAEGSAAVEGSAAAEGAAAATAGGGVVEEGS